jgi:hypothetical protein
MRAKRATLVSHSRGFDERAASPRPTYRSKGRHMFRGPGGRRIRPGGLPRPTMLIRMGRTVSCAKRYRLSTAGAMALFCASYPLRKLTSLSRPGRNALRLTSRTWRAMGKWMSFWKAMLGKTTDLKLSVPATALSRLSFPAGPLSSRNQRSSLRDRRLPLRNCAILHYFSAEIFASVYWPVHR